MTVQSAEQQSREQRRRKLRRSQILAALWLVLLAAALTGVTYAWFTGNRYTNVTPESYTVTDSSEDLLIGTSASGPFDTTATITADTSKTLYPISTSDLSNYWLVSFQNSNGISTDYSSADSVASDYYLTGSLYLKGSGSDLDVYLYPEGMSVTSDSQLLACLRLGLVISGDGISTQTYIFRLDDLGDTSGATSRVTTAKTDVVVSGSGSWSYVTDPAADVYSYSMVDQSGTPAVRSGATKLFTLPEDGVAQVTYFIYMEGCDENCIESAQSKDVSLKFAFGGTRAGE